MESSPPGSGVANIAAAMFVICVLIALMAIVVTLTSGNTDTVPGGVVPAASAGGNNG